MEHVTGDQLRHHLLTAFAEESNGIEGINGATPAVVAALAAFVELPVIAVEDLIRLVEVLEPGARLRFKPGMSVYVGDHVPPPGGPGILSALNGILARVNDGGVSPYTAHHEYETLHPFTDGNGRSGRALWAWQMLKQCGTNGLALGFLHRFYYQTLAAGLQR